MYRLHLFAFVYRLPFLLGDLTVFRLFIFILHLSTKYHRASIKTIAPCITLMCLKCYHVVISI